MTVREASVEWISLTITREKPGEQQPEQLAEALMQIAEDKSILVEDVIRWIELQEHHAQLRPSVFRHWAEAAARKGQAAMFDTSPLPE